MYDVEKLPAIKALDKADQLMVISIGSVKSLHISSLSQKKDSPLSP